MSSLYSDGRGLAGRLALTRSVTVSARHVLKFRQVGPSGEVWTSFNPEAWKTRLNNTI